MGKRGKSKGERIVPQGAAEQRKKRKTKIIFNIVKHLSVSPAHVLVSWMK